MSTRLKRVDVSLGDLKGAHSVVVLYHTVEGGIYRLTVYRKRNIKLVAADDYDLNVAVYLSALLIVLIEGIGINKHLRLLRLCRLIRAYVGLADLCEIEGCKIIALHHLRLALFGGNVDGNHALAACKNAFVKHDLKIIDPACKYISDILGVYRAADKLTVVCHIKSDILGKLAGEHVDPAALGKVDTAVCNSYKQGIALAHYHLLCIGTEVGILCAYLLFSHCPDLAACIGSVYGGHYLAVLYLYRKLCRAARDRGDLGICTLGTEGENGSAPVYDGIDDLLIFVVDLIGIIKADILGIVDVIYVLKRGAVTVAHLRLDHYLISPADCVEGGYVSVALRGIVYRNALAPRVSFFEDTHDHGAALLYSLKLKALACGVKEGGDIARSVGKRNVAVLQRCGVLWERDLALCRAELFALLACVIIGHDTVLALNLSYAHYLTDFCCAIREILDIKGTIAAVGKVAVAVNNVIEHIALDGDIDDRGKTLRNSFAYPLAALKTGELDAVSIGCVNVRLLVVLIVIVVGRNAEDVVIRVLCPDDYFFLATNTYLLEIFIRGLILAVYHGLGIGIKTRGEVKPLK